MTIELGVLKGLYLKVTTEGKTGETPMVLILTVSGWTGALQDLVWGLSEGETYSVVLEAIRVGQPLPDPVTDPRD